jgi:hypothetical protein
VVPVQQLVQNDFVESAGKTDPHRERREDVT